MRFRHATFLVILVVWQLAGCDAIEALWSSQQPDPADAPRPARVSFEIDDDLYYVTRQEDGDFRVVTRLEDVPLEHRGTVYVYPRGFMPDLYMRKTRHVANLLEARPGDTYMAELRGAEFIDASERAGRSAARASSSVARTAAKLAVPERTEGESVEPRMAAPVQRDRAERNHSGNNGGIQIEVVGGSMAPSRGAGRAAARSLPDVTIYYAEWCKPCHTAMDWMDARDVPYRAVDIEASDANRREMVDFCRKKGRSVGSVPTIRIGNKIMLGWNASRFQQLAGM